MTESAQQPEVSEVSNEGPQSARPEQVREFDAKLVQVLPFLTKEQMQHLIENPEEMRARLSTHGLGKIASIYPAEFLRTYRNRNFRDSWGDFYADEFQVDPDFTRIRLPDIRVHTYVTPIRVATQIRIEDILTVIQKHGVDLANFKINDGIFTDLSGGSDDLGAVVDIARPKENYIASFSTEISEKIPSPMRDERHYRGSCMTLREHLLWMAYCLYRRDTDQRAELTPNLASCAGAFATCGSTFGEQMPVLDFGKGASGADRLNLSSHYCGYVFFRSPVQVRRVKLFKSLPQI